MRTLLTAFTAAVSLFGCSETDTPTAHERLAGAWLYRLGDDCGIGYLFALDGTYDYRLGCRDGSHYNLETYSGDWVIEGDVMRFYPAAGSCSLEQSEGSGEPYMSRYRIDDGDRSLTLSASGGAVVFERVEDDGMPSGGAGYTFGCFVGDQFQPRDVQRF